jgi:hypothetical protein
LNGIPWAAERRRVAEIEIVEVFDVRFVEQRRSDNVDPLRDLRLAIANNLSAEQTTGARSPVIRIWRGVAPG